MKTMFLRLAMLAGVILSSLALPAQTTKGADNGADVDEVRSYIEMLRSDVNTDKIRTINRVMKLTGPEADKFWPIYRKYEKELGAVGDRKLALVREFFGYHLSGNMTDAKMQDLIKRWLKNVQERLDLWKKYQKEIGKALSPLRAAQFLQVEHQMALFVDLCIASEMPQIGATPK